MTAQDSSVVESPRLSFLLQKCLEQMRSLHRHDADRKGFGHSPTSILNLDLKNTIQKLQVGTNLPCLPVLFEVLPIREVSTLKVRSCQARREMLPLT